jgi:hypothetical protein
MKLSEHPLHVETLARLEVTSRGCLAITFDAVRCLGRTEQESRATSATASANEPPSSEALLLRMLTPLVKLFTGKLTVAVASEGVESFGGVGYCEDSGLPAILRDAQVLPIWEGTTNVLSMDVLRVLATSNGHAYQAFVSAIQTRVKGAESSASARMRTTAMAVQAALRQYAEYLAPVLRDIGARYAKQKDRMFGSLVLTQARDLAMGLSHLYCAALLLEHASATRNETDECVAERWPVQFPLCMSLRVM